MDGVNENVIEWVKGEKVAGVTAATATRLKGRIQKLAKEYPQEVQIIANNEDGSIFAHIPVKWIRINPGQRTKTEMSDEQRSQLAERLRVAREKAKAASED